MTAPQEPLKLTLEQVLLALSTREWWLEPRRGGWTVFVWDDQEDAILVRGHGKTWPEAASAALGRPVVARDDAAELRALLQRGRQKLATYASVYPGDKELRGLLAEWDAALAATEGEEA